MNRNTFSAIPHPFLASSWAIASKGGQCRSFVRDQAGGICHWHKRSDAIQAAQRLNATATARALAE